jgi:5,10-methylenetetrahydromethanopterin reductase
MMKGLHMMTYAFRLPPGPNTVAYAIAAERLGYERVWCPEVPAFGHDIWVTLARVAEQTSRIGIGAAVLIPSYRHPMAQASAIATIEAMAPGRLWAGFGTGFTGRYAMGQPALSLAHMRRHILQVRDLLRGEAVDRWRHGPVPRLRGMAAGAAYHNAAIAGVTGSPGPPVGA